jgi:nitrite reductase/ring-hydroxylating ferredoxin subunit
LWQIRISKVKGGFNKKMFKKIVIGSFLLSLIVIVVACSAPTSASVPAQQPLQIPVSAPAPAANPTPVPSNPKPSGPIKEKWMDPQVSGDIVSIPVSDVKNNWNTAFKIVNKGSTLNFMAYISNGEIQVRANVCPPCRSIGYSLTKDDVLVCDTCGTSFRAKDGSGIQGACVNYPKAAVQYKIADNNIVMTVNDLVTAYQKTLSGKG